MRTFTIVIFLAMLTGTAVAQDSPAPATGNAPSPATTQDRPLVNGNSTNGLGAVWQAPVGHRQPRAGDVPDEKNLSNPSDPVNKEDALLDKKIKSICRGC